MDRTSLQRFFFDVSYRVDLAERLQCQLDGRLATRFNVFDLIEPDENKLSDILAELLNPKGTHGQGDLFLRLFFEQLGLGSDPELRTDDATVQREAPMRGTWKENRRMDVFIHAAGVSLAIENKVDSGEQPEQVRDYLEHLRECPRGTVIYLTPERRPPGWLSDSDLEKYQRSKRLQCWSYQEDVSKWLTACRQGCEAQRIRDFLSDFIAYIESDLNRELEGDQEKQEDDDNE